MWFAHDCTCWFGRSIQEALGTRVATLDEDSIVVNQPTAGTVLHLTQVTSASSICLLTTPFIVSMKVDSTVLSWTCRSYLPQFCCCRNCSNVPNPWGVSTGQTKVIDKKIDHHLAHTISSTTRSSRVYLSSGHLWCCSPSCDVFDCTVNTQTTRTSFINNSPSITNLISHRWCWGLWL